MPGAFENLEKRLVERLDDGLLALQHKVSAAVHAHQTEKTTALIDKLTDVDTSIQKLLQTHKVRLVSWQRAPFSPHRALLSCMSFIVELLLYPHFPSSCSCTKMP